MEVSVTVQRSTSTAGCSSCDPQNISLHVEGAVTLDACNEEKRPPAY